MPCLPAVPGSAHQLIFLVLVAASAFHSYYSLGRRQQQQVDMEPWIETGASCSSDFAAWEGAFFTRSKSCLYSSIIISQILAQSLSAILAYLRSSSGSDSETWQCHVSTPTAF